MHWSLTGPNRDCIFRRRPSVDFPPLVRPKLSIDSPLHCFSPKLWRWSGVAIERGWLTMHRSGTYVRFTPAGADLFA